MKSGGKEFGLDEIECLEQEICGFLEAVQEGEAPDKLQSITFIAPDLTIANLFKNAIRDLFPNDSKLRITNDKLDGDLGTRALLKLSRTAAPLEGQMRVFVAMPYDDEMDDLFYYPIRLAAAEAKMICERNDSTPFTGSILQRIKDRICAADLVVADLSTQNPNVCLEVGYAWGKEKKTVLVVRGKRSLPIDASTENCITYFHMRDLQGKLRQHLEEARAERNRIQAQERDAAHARPPAQA